MNAVASRPTSKVKRLSLRTGLAWAMGLLVVVYAAGLTMHGATWTPIVDGWRRVIVDDWLGLLTDWMPVALCWLAVSRVGFRRWEVPLAAAAMTSFAVGDTYYLLKVAGGASLPFPSPGDAAFLLFYPFMLAALLVAVRRHVRGLAWSVWLEGAVGSLGAASVLAVLLSPVLGSAVTGSLSLAAVVAVAYPMFDLLLIAVVAGVAALRGTRMGSRWGLLIVGLMVFAAADVIYALQVAANTYVAGTPLKAGWAIGLALIAMWVDGTDRPDGLTRPKTRTATGGTPLMVSSVATAAGLGVLVAGTRIHLSNLATTLAGVALLAAAARTQVAYRQLARMADLRRQAFESARSMIESSLDALVAISPEGRITDVNEATVKVTGIPREELIGTAFSECFTEPEKANAIYQLVFDQGMAVDYQLTMRHRDGTLTEVLYNASVYRDAGGKVLGVFAAARDVTEHKQAEKEIAEQRGRELDRLAELERFQRLTVGRELKMIALKKEIESISRFVPSDGDERGDQF